MSRPTPPESDRTVISPFRKVTEKKQSPRKPSKKPEKPKAGKIAGFFKIGFGIVAVCMLIGVSAYTTIWYFSPPQSSIISEASLDENLVLNEEEPLLPPPVLQPEMIELSGDPIFIQRQENTADSLEKLPTQSDKTVLALNTTSELWYFNDVLLASNVNLMSSVPIKQESLVFFRQTGAGEENIDDSSGSPDAEPYKGENASGDNPQSPKLPEKTEGEIVDYVPPTRGTSISYILSENLVGRSARIQVLNKFLTQVGVAEFLVTRGFNQEYAKKVEERAKELFKIERFSTDDIVAIRGYRLHPADKDYAPTQVSFYIKGTFTGTLARADNEDYTIGEDPWFSKPLFEETNNRKPIKKHYRLLDAIYSAATRNNVPRSVIGEAILLLSKSFDLKSLAKPGETIEMIYATDPRDRKSGFGRTLYIAINRQPKKLECFVFRLKNRGDFECTSGKGAAKSVSSGMFTPVSGVLTSRFGPRMHPILKKMKMHAGVDWAAPKGTPVRAAFDGKVIFAGIKGGYGNFIKLSHNKRRGTGYGHLSRISKRAKKGKRVKAGQIIGYVGTTGRSTGPHLHFELYRNGRAVDPFGNFQTHIAKGGAVATMVNRIVRIESGGNPNAKNPLSSATGLGQFISSTWMRMIRRHRPDILKGRSRAQVLALRTDPDLALEMTTKLTQGNAGYLRSVGQTVTPGNLYLAHFLGPEGAARALRAAPDKSLLALFGAGVVKANPFLRGKDANWVINWAARKMNRKSGKYKRIKSAPINKYARSKPFQRFKTAVVRLLSNS